MPSTRHFLGWDRPILELAGERLLQRTSGSLLDLSDLLVIVPTQNSGRRLREVLAHFAAEKGKGILPPHVVPPEYLLSLISEPESGNVATPEEAVLAWIQVLLKANLQKYRALFPVEPVSQDFRWALGTAQALMELRRTLAEAGLEMADVPTLAGEELQELDRWLELARLEANFKQALKRQDCFDLGTIRKQNADSPILPPEVTEIWVIATPDPVPLTLRVLQRLSEELPMEVMVFAPEDLADDFDRWGRPKPEIWRERVIDIPRVEEMVHVLANSHAQADAAANFAQNYHEPAQSITIGLLDEEVSPGLERRLSAAGIPTFNPQGISLKTQGILHFFRSFVALLRERSYSAFIELLRSPDYLAYLSAKVIFWDTPRVFECFDKLYQKHLPQDLRSLRHFIELGKIEVTLEQITALNETERILTMIETKPFHVVFPELLNEIFSTRPLPRDTNLHRVLRAASDRLTPVMDAVIGPFGRASKLKAAEKIDLFLHFLQTEVLYAERDPNSVELLGWLELLWDDAPHLALTGFNDALVPEAIVGDSYLPESLRVTLASRVPFHTNEERYARDAYLFQAMLKSRERVDIMLGKRSLKGDPLRPSRLLFRCPDDELAQRCDALFKEVESDEANLPWTPGFLLKPRALPEEFETLESLAVTGFRDYLQSPLHFYFRHIEKMRRIDGEKQELDAAGFGTFCHEVLRRFGTDRQIRDSRDYREIRAYFENEADNLALLWFGKEHSLPLQIQLRSAKQRLRAAAEVQAREREDGWRIEDAEIQLGSENWLVSGVMIKGMVDRVDIHERTGAIRVLDYKTADNPVQPAMAHVSKITATTNRDWLPEYACFDYNDLQYRWQDLQLPLYRIGLDMKHDHDIVCGYFNLPKAVGDTGIHVWDHLCGIHDDAAIRCAEGVIQDVQSGKFWPHANVGRWDDFAALHLSAPDKTIDPILVS